MLTKVNQSNLLHLYSITILLKVVLQNTFSLTAFFYISSYDNTSIHILEIQKEMIDENFREI